MSYQFDTILGAGRDSSVSLTEQQKGFDAGTAAQKAAFQASVSGGVAISPTDTPSDVRQRIQSALDTGGRVVVRGRGYMTGTLYVGDETELVIEAGSTLTQHSTGGSLMIRSKQNAVWLVTNLTSSSLLVSATIPGHNLTAGEYVSIDWAIEYGYSGTHRVHAVSGDVVQYYAYELPAATTATVSPSAATSSYSAGNYIQARRATVRPRVIVDGILDWNSAGVVASTSGINNFAVLLDHAAEPYIEARGVIKNARKYATCLANVCAATTGDINVDTNSDGLHLIGPVHSYVGSGRIAGRADDNLIGAGSGDYIAYLVSEGSLTGIRLPDAHVEKHTVDAVRFFGASQYPMDIEVGNITGAMPGGSGISLPIDTVVAPNGNAWSRRITQRGEVAVSGTAYAVSIAHPRVDYISVAAGSGSNVTQIRFSASAVVSVADCRVHLRYPGVTQSGVSVDPGATITRLRVSGRAVSTMQSANVVNISGAVGTVDLEALHVEKNLTVVKINATTVTDVNILLRGCTTVGTHRVVDCASGSGRVKVYLSGGTYNTTGDPYYNSSTGSAVLAIYGAGAAYSRSTTIGRTASQAIECYTLDAPVDLSLLTRADGQIARNSNAALNNGADGAVGSGAFACVGTASGSWRRIGTGGGVGHQY